MLLCRCCSTRSCLQASAKEVQDSAGAAALRDQLKNLADGLNGAASGMSTVIDGIVKGIPGPLLNSTLAVIERQVSWAQPVSAIGMPVVFYLRSVACIGAVL
jgi:hypothetical protein